MDIFLLISRFFDQGGDVLYLIAATTFLMWMLIFERAYYFFFEHKHIVSEVVHKWESREERRSWTAHAIRTTLLSQAITKIRGSMPIILTCITLWSTVRTTWHGHWNDSSLRCHGDSRWKRAFNGRWCIGGHDTNDVWDDSVLVWDFGSNLVEAKDFSPFRIAK